MSDHHSNVTTPATTPESRTALLAPMPAPIMYPQLASYPASNSPLRGKRKSGDLPRGQAEPIQDEDESSRKRWKQDELDIGRAQVDEETAQEDADIAGMMNGGGWQVVKIHTSSSSTLHAATAPIDDPPIVPQYPFSRAKLPSRTPDIAEHVSQLRDTANTLEVHAHDQELLETKVEMLEDKVRVVEGEGTRMLALLEKAAKVIVEQRVDLEEKDRESEEKDRLVEEINVDREEKSKQLEENARDLRAKDQSLEEKDQSREEKEKECQALKLELKITEKFQGDQALQQLSEKAKGFDTLLARTTVNLNSINRNFANSSSNSFTGNLGTVVDSSSSSFPQLAPPSASENDKSSSDDPSRTPPQLLRPHARSSSPFARYTSSDESSFYSNTPLQSRPRAGLKLVRGEWVTRLAAKQYREGRAELRAERERVEAEGSDDTF